MARRTLLIAYVATYLLAIGAIIRFLFATNEEHFWPILFLLGVYLVLLFSEPVLRRNRLLFYCYILVQTVIIGAVSLVMPNVDFWAALFFPLILHVTHNLPQRTGFLITGIFTLIMAVLMLLGVGPEQGLPLVLINGVVYILFAAFIVIIREAEAARARSEKQQAELQTAYQQLQSYTVQAEELAVLQERNRMARNLHDSVTQTIFSMRLTAEAANMLLVQNPSRVGAELDKLQSLAKSALAEMRSLIMELRPTAVTELGFVPALRHHLIAMERQYGLMVDLQVTGEPHLTETESQRLFRISQEALNNVVKHAQTDKAWLTVCFDGQQIDLTVKDQGQGFDPEALNTTDDHVGLAVLQERVDAMGGLLTIDSQPGQGTLVMVEVTSTSEEMNNG